MTRKAELARCYEFRVRPLGLTLGLSWRGVWVRRWRPEVEDIRERSAQWFRYCQSVHRR